MTFVSESKTLISLIIFMVIFKCNSIFLQGRCKWI